MATPWINQPTAPSPDRCVLFCAAIFLTEWYTEWYETLRVSYHSVVRPGPSWPSRPLLAPSHAASALCSFSIPARGPRPYARQPARLSARPHHDPRTNLITPPPSLPLRLLLRQASHLPATPQTAPPATTGCLYGQAPPGTFVGQVDRVQLQIAARSAGLPWGWMDRVSLVQQPAVSEAVRTGFVQRCVSLDNHQGLRPFAEASATCPTIFPRG